MFSHVMVGTNDIERSKRFYDAVLGVLGAGPATSNKNATGQTRIFYRHDGSTFCVSEPIDGKPASVANGATLGFKCSSAEQLRQFHDVAVAHGGEHRVVEALRALDVVAADHHVAQHAWLSSCLLGEATRVRASGATDGLSGGSCAASRAA